MATKAELTELMESISNSSARHLDGSTPSASIQQALFEQESKTFYPIFDEIFAFLPNFAITLCQRDVTTKPTDTVSELSKFYDEFGWKETDEGVFEDAKTFEDLRGVSAEYIKRAHDRVKEELPPRGTFLLDAASGPIQFDDYLQYSENYEYRICLDVSIQALRQAKKRIGQKGIFVLGDIANLPLRSDSIDATVSLHTIYHVHESLQKRAFEEIHRTLKPGGVAVVVYTWGNHSPLSTVLDIPAKITKPLRQRLRAGSSSSIAADAPQLYFCPQSRDWFRKQQFAFPIELKVWRSFSVTSLKTYMHEWLLGRQFLRILVAAEETFPELFGKVGQYPMFVIRKQVGSVR